MANLQSRSRNTVAPLSSVSPQGKAVFTFVYTPNSAGSCGLHPHQSSQGREEGCSKPATCRAPAWRAILFLPKKCYHFSFSIYFQLHLKLVFVNNVTCLRMWIAWGSFFWLHQRPFVPAPIGWRSLPFSKELLWCLHWKSCDHICMGLFLDFSLLCQYCLGNCSFILKVLLSGRVSCPVLLSFSKLFQLF